MAGLLQIGRHALAHHPQSDKADAHLDPPPLPVLVRFGVWPGIGARARGARPSRRNWPRLPAAALSAGDDDALDTGEIGNDRRPPADRTALRISADGRCLSLADLGGEEAARPATAAAVRRRSRDTRPARRRRRRAPGSGRIAAPRAAGRRSRRARYKEDWRSPRRTGRSAPRPSFRRQNAPARRCRAARHCRAPSWRRPARYRSRCRSPPDTRTAAPAADSRCRYRDRENGKARSRSGKRVSTASTIVSLSGRGSSVSADSRNSQPPEFAPPDDPAQRLARQHPLQHRRDASLLRRGSAGAPDTQRFRPRTGRAPPRAAPGRAAAARRSRPRSRRKRHVRARRRPRRPGSRLYRGQLGGAVGGGQRVDDLVERLAGHDFVDLVKGQVDAVIGDAALREVIGADALGAVAAADLALAIGGAGRVRAPAAPFRRAGRAAPSTRGPCSCAAISRPAGSRQARSADA